MRSNAIEAGTWSLQMRRWRPVVLLMLIGLPCSGWAGEPSPGLPRYDLDVHLDTANRLASVRETVTWTNTSKKALRELVFNAHARYTIPDDQVGLLAKMLEILRLSPSEAFQFEGPPLEVQRIEVNEHSISRAPVSGGRKPPVPLSAAAIQATAGKLKQGADSPRSPLRFHYPEDNPTSLVIALPHEVQPGESITLQLDFTLKIPPKKGRWGQWDSVTALAQWLPVVAVLDEKGDWHPAPFIPWHQPFHNEAGVYTVRVTLPSDHLLASSGIVAETRDLGDGWTQHVIAPICLRDFALVASARFQEHVGQVGKTRIRVLALPEHEHYAKEAVKIVAEAMPVYSKWFGDYPYPQFTVAEAFFGWNGNECGSLVLIDSRMFGLPHLARPYFDQLVSHELCHQWWYNVVGTHGYAETWMDEGVATYFTRRLMDQKGGKDQKLIEFPRGLEWLPNITRDDFNNYGYLGARARGETQHATVQEMPKFGHLVNLSAYTYDRGSKVVGMIEERLGGDAMLDFMRRVYSKYQYRILRVADFQKELEAYTGRSWEDFFQQWVYSGGTCDWSVERVEQSRPAVGFTRVNRRAPSTKYVVHLRQTGGHNEPTTLGFRFKGDNGYQLRLPIHPDVTVMRFDDLNATVECVPDGDKGCRAKVEIEFFEAVPTQITVDPDRVLLDERPTNNHWKDEVRWRFTPLYTQIEEADVANAYDRWNVIAGPWIYGSAFNDPWYTRSPLFGAKASVFRTQEFLGGLFVAYRANDRNIIAGGDVVWDHVPLPNTQVGLSVEHSLATVSDDDIPCSRGVLYGRYIITPTSSLYLPPFEYIETFGVIQNRCLPDPRRTLPGTDLFDERVGLGIHYHKNYMTPYWDAEAGIAVDVSYQYGLPIIGNEREFHQVYGQVSTVKKTPKLEWLGDHPVLDWLRQTRWAFRFAGAAALPDDGVFFSLGGGDLFRGYDLEERQGSITWVGSIEARIPIYQNVCWDFCDHFMGIRNVYVAPFYDVGDAYVRGRSLDAVAHAIGLGLRVDVAWLGLIERTIIRLDVAQPLGGDHPLQFWFGVGHAF